MLDSDAILEKAASLKADNQPFVLVTVVRSESSTSAKPGAKAVVEADGVIQGWVGGGCAQPAVIKMAKKALQDGQPRLIRISPSKEGVIEQGIEDFGMTCHSGGTLDIFIDPVIPRPLLLIIGASPVAQALCGLAHRTGFAVTAAFPQAEQSMFPEAETIISSLEIPALSSARPTFVVASTQGKRDEAGLEAALNTGAEYIAFIASDRKATKLRQYLNERGHDSARIDAIVSPAGIDIGAVTPEEIALSVLSAVVKARRKGLGKITADNPGALSAKATIPEAAISENRGSCCGGSDNSKESAPAQGIDPICGMTVDTTTAEYTHGYQGVTYYFCCAGCQHSFAKTPEKYLEAGT